MSNNKENQRLKDNFSNLGQEDFIEYKQEDVINKSQTKRTFWDRIPKYRWWVTPLNILLICIFLLIIDIATKPNVKFWGIDWAWWPIGGLIFTYTVSFILFKRPEIAWIVGPLLMIGTALLLFTLDYVYSPNTGFLNLDWAVIPIAAVLTFGVLIPIVTKFGRKKEKPIDKFRKAITEMKKEEVKEENKEQKLVSKGKG